MKAQRFYIEGMSCTACSISIQRALKRKEYVKDIEIHFLSKVANIYYDEMQASLDDIFAFIKKLGYTPSLIFEDSESFVSDSSQITQDRSLKIFSNLNVLEIIERLDRKFLSPNKRLVLSIVFTLLTLYLSMFMMFFPSLVPSGLQGIKFNAILQFIFSLIVMHIGRAFYFRGFGTLIKGSPNMDTLIAIGTTSAFIYSFYQLLKIFMGLESSGLYFESVCVIITFVLLGKTIENRSKIFATNALKGLISRKSKNAIKVEGWFENKLKNKKEIEIKIDEIVPNDILKILPGTYIPTDGIVLEGMANIDESMLTGEVLPVFKDIGETVYSGSINTDSTFFIQAIRPAYLSALAKIILLIKSAQESKAPIARIADKLSAFFVPVVIGIAVVAGIFWWIQKDFAFGLEIFISVLVISCPCALGLATPMSIMVGSGRSASGGIFFKNAQSLENAQKVTTVVFDKTGTLSMGKLCVQEVIGFERNSDELLSVASAIESGSEHVIAQAIVAYSKQRGVVPKIAQDFQIKAGYGICARIGDETFKLGNQDIFTSAVFPKISTQAFEKGLIIVWVAKVEAKGDKILGAILLKDTLKKNARETIIGLKNIGIKTAILSGDNIKNVQIIADELGVAEVIAEAKPSDKLDFIRLLQDRGEIVMMVGDGINDAPALALADVALAMGKGSDTSLENADIIIFSDDTQGVLHAISLSKATIKNIKENLFWAFCYNAVFIPLACGVAYKAGILLNPMISSLAMSLSSLSVVLNAQQLRKFKFGV